MEADGLYMETDGLYMETDGKCLGKLTKRLKIKGN